LHPSTNGASRSCLSRIGSSSNGSVVVKGGGSAGVTLPALMPATGWRVLPIAQCGPNDEPEIDPS
jgi:hypothetical protein